MMSHYDLPFTTIGEALTAWQLGIETPIDGDALAFQRLIQCDGCAACLV